MSEALNAARESLRKAEADFERNEDCRNYPRMRQERRDALTEQWLKLAAIDNGINPWASNQTTAVDQ